MSGFTPSLYVLVESEQRELDAKLLVACAFAEAGGTSVIGRQLALVANFGKLPPGVVLFKGLNRVQAESIALARHHGHVAIANDEEALGAINPDLMLRDVDPAAVALANVLMVNGRGQGLALIEKRGAERRRIALTGNPRLDLLKPAFRGLYQEEADALRHRFGDFILVNTNVGGLNSVWGNLDRYFAICVEIGWVDPGKPEDRALFDRHITFDKVNMRELKAVVPALRRAFPALHVVVRPHPVEQAETWEERFADMEGVTVLREGGHIPWLLAARLVVHTGCTTGLEAFLLDRPALSIRSPESDWHDNQIANLVNPTAPDANSAIAVARGLLEAGGDPIDPAVMADHLAFPEPFAFTATADVVGKVFSALRVPLEPFAWTPRAPLRERRSHHENQRKKFTADGERIQASIQRIGALLGRFHDLEVETIADAIFHIRRREPN